MQSHNEIEILGNMCIAIVYFPGCDVMDFEINLSSHAVVTYEQKV